MPFNACSSRAALPVQDLLVRHGLQVDLLAALLHSPSLWMLPSNHAIPPGLSRIHFTMVYLGMQSEASLNKAFDMPAVVQLKLLLVIFGCPQVMHCLLTLSFTT